MSQNQLYKMATWITSDLHFDHANVIKYCPESRGMFESVQQMNDTIIHNMNILIRPEDTLYILGDISFGKHDAACEMLRRINGSKIIIHGNHDTKLVASDVFKNSMGKMRVVEHTPYKFINHTVEGKRYGVALFHFPIEVWDRKHYGSIHLHGHQHSPNNQPLGDIRRMDIGLDSNFMMPYNLDSVICRLSSIPLTKNDQS